MTAYATRQAYKALLEPHGVGKKQSVEDAPFSDGDVLKGDYLIWGNDKLQIVQLAVVGLMVFVQITIAVLFVKRRALAQGRWMVGKIIVVY